MCFELLSLEAGLFATNNQQLDMFARKGERRTTGAIDPSTPYPILPFLRLSHAITDLDDSNAERLSALRGEWESLLADTAARNARKLAALANNRVSEGAGQEPASCQNCMEGLE
eukprot:1156271-Pelagomonas_calceolata.AAC.3